MAGGLSDTLLNSALFLASRGCKVFPLIPGSKKPAVKDWQDAATTDEAQVRQWWGGTRAYNIGVKTGEGLIVVDIDIKNGKPGAESWKALGVSADTFRVKTASGGWHVYFAGDGDSSVDRLGRGLDVRGRGGYVVAPGSVLTNGSGTGEYRINLDRPLTDLPAALRDRLGDPRERPERSASPAVDLDRMDAIDRGIEYLATAPLALEGSGGDLTTYKVAAKLKDFGISKVQAFLLMDEHWNERCEPPWKPEGLEEKIENAYAYGLDALGSQHPVAAFSDVRVDIPVDHHSSGGWYRHGDPWIRSASWLYYEVAPAVGVAVVVGPPGSGKTFVQIELSRSVATGKPFFGVAPDRRGGVIFLYAGTEGSAFPKRLEALGEGERLPISMHPIGDLSERGALGKVLEMCRAEAACMKAEFGVDLCVVVIETLNASGLLVNENDNAEIGRALANLGTLSRELNCLVITSHHPPKSGDGERGGGAIRGSADCILSITREGTDAIRRLELTKAREAAERPLGTFTLLKTDMGQDDRGRPITSMTVSMGEPISRVSERSQYGEVLGQAVEFALMEETVDIEGHKAAEWGAVMENFRDLKSGSKDRPKVLAAFKAAVQYAKDTGAMGSGVYAGVVYLWMKEIPE